MTNDYLWLTVTYGYGYGGAGPGANLLGKYGDVVGVLWLRLHDRKTRQGAKYRGSEPAEMAEVYLQGLLLLGLGLGPT